MEITKRRNILGLGDVNVVATVEAYADVARRRVQAWTGRQNRGHTGHTQRLGKGYSCGPPGANSLASTRVRSEFCSRCSRMEIQTTPSPPRPNHEDSRLSSTIYGVRSPVRSASTAMTVRWGFGSLSGTHFKVCSAIADGKVARVFPRPRESFCETTKNSQSRGNATLGRILNHFYFSPAVRSLIAPPIGRSRPTYAGRRFQSLLLGLSYPNQAAAQWGHRTNYQSHNSVILPSPVRGGTCF